MSKIDGPKPSDANMILIMGVTGSGKSHFINKLAGKTVVQESALLDSCTAVCQAVPIEIGKTKVLLIDTPGFDDSERTDTEILTEISRLLTAQYKLGVSLKGVIYLHRITDNRYQGSSVRTLEIFKQICGDRALKNVILASTRWDEVDESTGALRENGLRQKFWSYMIAHGSTMTRFHGDRDSARVMVSQLIGSGNVVLDLQHQLVDQGLSLDETSAGSLVNGGLDERISSANIEIERLRRQLCESNDTLQRKLREDRQREEDSIVQARKDQVSLRTHVGQDVQDELDVDMHSKRKRSKKFGFILPLLPAALSTLAMFFNIPSGVTQLFTSWIVGDEYGNGGILSEIFSHS